MRTNQLKAGVLLSYLSMFLSNAVAIIYTPVMLRLMGQSEYGLYSLASSVIGYLGLLSFGFDSSYVRYFSRYRVKKNDDGIAALNGMFLIVFSVIGALALAAGGILTANAENIFRKSLTAYELDRATVLMGILTVNMALSFPATVFLTHITANEKYIFQKILNIVKAVTGPFVTLPLLILGWGSVGMAAAATVVNLTLKAASVIYCVRRLHIRFAFSSFDKQLFHSIFVFSSYIFINILVDQINWSIDKFLLGIYRGTAAVAVYGIASQLNTYYMSFSTSISTVFVPRINKMAAAGDDGLTELFARVGRIQFIVLSLILSGLIFFGRPFIYMWAGTDYSESYRIALILIIPVTVPLIQVIGMEIQRAKNMHSFRAFLYLFIAILNLALSIPLCRMFGGTGCAAGTAVALIIGNGIIMNIYYHKKVGINVVYFWRQIATMLPSLIAPVAAGMIITIFADLYSVRIFALCVALYTLIFGASMYIFGMNTYERSLVLKLKKR